MKPMNEQKKDFQFGAPPVIGDPSKPVDPLEPPLRGEQSCSNCDAMVIINNYPACGARPPRAILMGVQQSKTVDPRTGQPYPLPMMLGGWPPTEPEHWCRKWKWIGPKGGE